MGAALRILRFRLSDRGPVPGGVGEERGVPVFARATTRIGSNMTLHAYAGVVLDGRLRVEDANGNRLSEDDYDPSLMLGLTLVARF